MYRNDTWGMTSCTSSRASTSATTAAPPSLASTTTLTSSSTPLRTASVEPRYPCVQFYSRLFCFCFAVFVSDSLFVLICLLFWHVYFDIYYLFRGESPSLGHCCTEWLTTNTCSRYAHHTHHTTDHPISTHHHDDHVTKVILNLF